MQQSTDAFGGAGRTVIYAAINGKLAGLIAIADAPREMGIQVAMLTGDTFPHNNCKADEDKSSPAFFDLAQSDVQTARHSARLFKPEMREIDRQGAFRELGVQPIQEFQVKQRIECEPFSRHAVFRQNLCVDKASILGFTDQSSLREGAAQSTCKRRFTVEHTTRQLPIDDRIGENEPPARL